ncbi:gamma-glutamyl-gamma-aminobutyrate hydrolase family protein [Algiphilus sp.]|uniref:gamma-glutamyl-gamma-aminobutyrate hydrolase family protein n=1 Tax=Algiphilus sp. TaxID=1872431 RepID=UPI0025C4E4A1|nr:gamma-glutamyl-gamma-aminobutyrate hydrolase family protein [Algiphilus sp.]MCK5769873.1 gamma-glutamyl-gamma-aminobutyrate hydrolase family protein [Algiphilus sp.]
MAAGRRIAGRRPLIGITGGDASLPWGWWFAAAAVRASGGRPLRITPSRPLGERHLDGLIVGGGDDIDPSLYSDDDPGAPAADPARDRLELALLDIALADDLPVLGICRGAQLLNVASGGSLYADIRHRRRLTSNRRTVLPRKTAVLRPGSRLARICGDRTLRVNSLHHQAVRDLGRGLRTVARDADGIKQAVEAPGTAFRIGVQWHPEYLPQKRAQRRLIAALVRRAGRRSRGIRARD